MSEEKNINSHSLKCKENVWKKFVSLIDEMDNVNTQGQALERLIDVYEEPPKTKILDKEIASQNEDLIKKNQELTDEIDELQETIASLKAELAKHQEEAESRSKAMADKPENVFEVEVHPVAFHFLKGMADKTKKTPGYILTDLFIRDLQNPRANNLPYIVASSEIKAKLEEYKKSHPEEYQRKEA
jgi:predicted nuclease with TOPRIM domain